MSGYRQRRRQAYPMDIVLHWRSIDLSWKVLAMRKWRNTDAWANQDVEFIEKTIELLTDVHLLPASPANLLHRHFHRRFIVGTNRRSKNVVMFLVMLLVSGSEIYATQYPEYIQGRTEVGRPLFYRRDIPGEPSHPFRKDSAYAFGDRRTAEIRGNRNAERPKIDLVQHPQLAGIMRKCHRVARTGRGHRRQ